MKIVGLKLRISLAYASNFLNEQKASQACVDEALEWCAEKAGKFRDKLARAFTFLFFVGRELALVRSGSPDGQKISKTAAFFFE